MPDPKTKNEQQPNWTPNHDDALAALIALRVPEKEARKLVSAVPGGETGDILRAALRGRNPQSNQKNFRPKPGGPSGAMPLNPTPPGPSGPASRAPRMGAPAPATGSILKNFIPQKPQPKAPSPAAAQMKPAINLRSFVPRPPAEGAQQPMGAKPAPLGGSQKPEAGPAEPPPGVPRTIRTYEEYEKLEPGEQFVWPDGHVYRKPANAS